jgi:hypothetical protein
LEAYLQEIGNSGGGEPRDCAIAKKIGINRQTLGRWRRRYPGFSEWVAKQIELRAGNLGAAVLHSCAQSALKGSARHAELYLKATRRLGS